MSLVEYADEKRRPGQPTKYEARFADIAERHCLLGATIDDLAAAFKVAVSTVNLWISSIPEFSDAVARGRSDADARMAQSLFNRGLGAVIKQRKPVTLRSDDGSTRIEIAEYDEAYPPDTMAASLWLRNRRPDLWRDKQEHDVTVTGRIARLDDEERAAKALQLVQGMLGKPAEPIDATAIDVTPSDDKLP